MDITRFQSDGLRFYTNVEENVSAPSVTTVIGEQLVEDGSGLHYWKQNNDGQEDNPFHEHLFWYSAPLGTLCHYEALKTFEDDLYGDEERTAMRQLVSGPTGDTARKWQNEGIPTSRDAIAYSVLKKRKWTDVEERGDSVPDLFKIAREDCEWFSKQFSSLCDECGVTDDSVLCVEQFLLDGDLAGGQCDMVYEDDGEYVVADLKTSSGFRQKHLIQCHAYAMLLENSASIPVDSIDRYEVWRANPERREVRIHSNVEASEHHTTEHFYDDEYGNWEYDDSQEVRDTFEAMCSQFK